MWYCFRAFRSGLRFAALEPELWRDYSLREVTYPLVALPLP